MNRGREATPEQERQAHPTQDSSKLPTTPERDVAQSTTAISIQTVSSPSTLVLAEAPISNRPRFHVNDIVKIKRGHSRPEGYFTRIAQVTLKQYDGREVWHYRIGDDKEISESGNDFMRLGQRRQNQLKKPWRDGPKVGGEVDFPTLFQGMASNVSYSRGKVVQRIVADGQVYLRVFCPQPVLTLSLLCTVPSEEDRKRPKIGASVTFPTPDQGMGLSVRMTSAKVVQLVELGHDAVVRLDTMPILTLNLNGIVVATGDEAEATGRGEVSDAPWTSEVEGEATDEDDDQDDDCTGEHIDSEGIDMIMSDDGGGNDLENWLPERNAL
jgi:hypothetical protein